MVQPGWTGRLIDGRYAVESVIGAGGMGLVLKAHHQFTGAEVAVKVLKSELAEDPEVQSRFLAEARAPNAIGHPGIVSVLDAGKAPDGLLYLVMELLQGRPLRTAMNRGEITAADTRRIMLELLDALSAAHTRGFVHRDLKPENLFLCGPQQQVKLLDFGIAKVLDSGLVRVRTATNAQLGTPAYMAPEQFNNPGGVDGRADLWAVGIMAYEMLAGRLPYRADTPQAVLVAIAMKEFEPITKYVPNCPPAVAQFFERALAIEREHRFPSAIEMGLALGALPLGHAPAPPRAHRASQPVAHVPAPAPVAIGSQTMATGYGTMATGHGTMATGVGVPQSTAPLGHATPAPHHAPTGMTTGSSAPPGSSKRAWVLGLGLATIVSMTIVIIAVMVTRKPAGSSAPPPPIATRPPPTDAGPIAVAEPPLDATSARDTAIASGLINPDKDKKKPPRDAGVPARPDASVGPRDPYATPAVKKDPPKKDPPADPRTDPRKPPEKAPEPPAAKVFTFEDQCRVGCEAALRQCNNVPKARCMSDCLALPKMRECLALPLGTCNEVAICTTRATCGPQALQGSKTCGETASCELVSCSPGDVTCSCKCKEQMSWRYAQQKAAADACALNCGFDAACAAKYCTYQATACK